MRFRPQKKSPSCAPSAQMRVFEQNKPQTKNFFFFFFFQKKKVSTRPKTTSRAPTHTDERGLFGRFQKKATFPTFFFFFFFFFLCFVWHFNGEKMLGKANEAQRAATRHSLTQLPTTFLTSHQRKKKTQEKKKKKNARKKTKTNTQQSHTTPTRLKTHL
jgi:hypothetical protein